MVKTSMKNCTTLTKQHITTNSMQANHSILKKAPRKEGMKANKEKLTSLQCSSTRSPHCYKHVNRKSWLVIFKDSSSLHTVHNIFCLTV